jgi:transposase InsO family protein
VPYAARFELKDDLPKQITRTGHNIDFYLDLFGVHRSTYYGWFSDTGELLPPVTRKSANPRKVRDAEMKAIVEYRRAHMDVGYRKLTWMMVDENIAFLSESSVYQILSDHDLLSPWLRDVNDPAAKEYKHKPKYPHHHWHTDIAYIKINNVFYFLIMLLDGYSRFLLDWELMPDMLGSSVELFVQRAKEKYPFAKPMLIHDNGGQFVSRDFKLLASRIDITSVCTRRNHPQTNGKIERMNGTVKNEAIRPNCPTDYQDACEILNQYGYTYNYQRLHAGINYLRPADMFFGRGNQILTERDEKMKTARYKRQQQNMAEIMM